MAEKNRTDFEAKSVTLEIPKHILARAASLASHFDCSSETIMLAGIVNFIESGNNSTHIGANRDDFRFKLMLAESIQRQTTVEKPPNFIERLPPFVGKPQIMENVRGIVAQYIDAYSSHFTTFEAKTKISTFNQKPITVFSWGQEPKGEITGRCAGEADGSVTLAIPVAKINSFAAERGIDKTVLHEWAEEQGGRIANVRLSSRTASVRALVLPISQKKI